MTSFARSNAWRSSGIGGPHRLVFGLFAAGSTFVPSAVRACPRSVRWTCSRMPSSRHSRKWAPRRALGQRSPDRSRQEYLVRTGQKLAVGLPRPRGLVAPARFGRRYEGLELLQLAVTEGGRA